MRLRRTTLVLVPIEQLGAALLAPSLFDEITAPMLRFIPVDPPVAPQQWSVGARRFRLLVGGRLPIGEHTIDTRAVGEPDPTLAGDQLVWHDAGHSDLIRVWDHKILLKSVIGGTVYTDEVEIHAGPLTIPAWLFAHAFYRHRQRRLARLAADGALG